MTKQRIAILGGGMGSLAAAWELTATPELRARHDVTVYQMGWRLGGKGASGRNAARAQRIEEHGLHVLMGCYANTFRILRACYAELGRPAGAPLASWQQAFTPHSYIVVAEQRGSAWKPWVLDFPTNGDVPGDGGVAPSAWAYVQMLLGWLDRVFRTSVLAGEGAGRVAAGALRAAQSLAGERRPEARGFPELVARFRSEVAALAGGRLDLDEIRRLWIMTELATTVCTGLVVDGIAGGDQPWSSIDDEDLRAWLARHGASQAARDSALVRSIYDLGFAGDGEAAAGTAIHGVLRMCLTYKGSVFYKMAAGMGDAVFAPLYEVLRRRGVRFEFFHRVDRLTVAPGTKEVASIELGRQATPIAGAGAYEPLVDLDGLPCWPAAPRHELLVEGEAIARGRHNLEGWWDAWPDVARVELRAGRDFDRCVLGIAVGALRELCGDLIAADAPFREMVEHLRTTQTQAAQLWFDPPLGGLGWTRPAPVLDGFAEPFDTWADMSHLLPAERWAEEQRPRSLAYLCSRLPDDEAPPPRSDHDYPARQARRVRANLAAWLGDAAPGLWPAAAARDRAGFAWELLHAPAELHGPERLGAQYWQATASPSERYVLSVPGSTRHRLRADQSGFSNLVLAGDWLFTGFNAGCLEGATIGGLQAARAICGSPAVIVGDPGAGGGGGGGGEDPGPGEPGPGPAEREPPPHIARGGDVIVRAPWRMTRTSSSWLVVPADEAKLRALCARYLDAPARGAATHVPVGPFAMLVSASVVRAQATEPPDAQKGWLGEKDVGFWVPLWQRRPGERDRLVWFLPYVWVDNPAAAVSGREIYGFPKAQATIRMPDKAGEVGRITVDALMIEDFGPDTSAVTAPLLQVAPSDAGRARLSNDLAWWGDPPWDDLVAAVAASDATGGARFGATLWTWLQQIVDALRRRTLDFVLLKQVPDAVDSSRACYQAVIVAPARIELFRGAGLLPPHRIVITPADSHPIVDELGLSGHVLSAPIGLWVSFDFSMAAGTVIAQWPPR